jgi:hypothetical protein
MRTLRRMPTRVMSKAVHLCGYAQSPSKIRSRRKPHRNRNRNRNRNRFNSVLIPGSTRYRFPGWHPALVPVAEGQEVFHKKRGQPQRTGGLKLSLAQMALLGEASCFCATLATRCQCHPPVPPAKSISISIAISISISISADPARQATFGSKIALYGRMSNTNSAQGHSSLRFHCL